MFSASFSNSGVGGGILGAALGAASLVGSVAMAGAPTFVSLIASGSLSVTTDKPYYVSGDLIQGVVTANIVQPISCRRIVVQVVGQEKVEINRHDTEWVDQGQGQPRRAVHYVRRYRNRRYFFNLSIPVYDLQNGTLMPGNYTFPFQYQLPDGLPGSFFERQELEHLPPGVIYEDAHPQHHHRHNSYQGAVADFGDAAFCDSDDELGAVVQNRHGLAQYRRPRLLALVHYKLRVVLDVNGFFAPDLRAKRAIVIHPRLGAEVKPAFAERHTDVMVCCCINKGRCGLSVHFDRNAYCPGERANIMAKVENHSTKPLRLQIRLMRKLEVVTQGHHLGSHREESQVLYQEVEGAPPGETVERPMPLNLPGDLRPTTIGEFVKCTYTYVVTAKVSWGSDIKLIMPVTLYAPQPSSF